MTHSDGPPTAMVQGSWTEKAHAAIEIIESMERTFTGTNPATSGKRCKQLQPPTAAYVAFSPPTTTQQDQHGPFLVEGIEICVITCRSPMQHNVVDVHGSCLTSLQTPSGSLHACLPQDYA